VRLDSIIHQHQSHLHNSRATFTILSFYRPTISARCSGRIPPPPGSPSPSRISSDGAALLHCLAARTGLVLQARIPLKTITFARHLPRTLSLPLRPSAGLNFALCLGKDGHHHSLTTHNVTASRRSIPQSSEPPSLDHNDTYTAAGEFAKTNLVCRKTNVLLFESLQGFSSTSVPAYLSRLSYLPFEPHLHSRTGLCIFTNTPLPLWPSSEPVNTFHSSQ